MVPTDTRAWAAVVVLSRSNTVTRVFSEDALERASIATMSSGKRFFWYPAALLLLTAFFSGCHNRSQQSVTYGESAGAAQSVSAQNASAAMVSLVFDDGFLSAYNFGMPIVDAAGLKTTQYIITGSIGQQGYITQDEILALQAKGHEIGAHTRTNADLPQLTPAELKSEVNGSIQDLARFGVHAKTFAYPYGDVNDRVVALLKSEGIESARTTSDGLNDAHTSPFRLKCKLVIAGTKREDVQAWIDEARSKGDWLILVFHRIDDDGNPISASEDVLQAAVDTLVAKKVRVVTVSEGMEILKSGAK